MSRHEIAPETLFVSHETYTPARGGSAAAEINALRHVFGPDADRVVIGNTKGMTGHPMGVGIEDVLAVKALETGIVPPIPNFRDVDPELGRLNLSTGGAYPIRYALRLAAGFGSQISMTLLRWTPVPDGQHRAPTRSGTATASWTPRRGVLAAPMSGTDDPTLEVVQRRLRVVDTGPPGGARGCPAAGGQAAAAAYAVAAPGWGRAGGAGRGCGRGRAGAGCAGVEPVAGGGGRPGGGRGAVGGGRARPGTRWRCWTWTWTWRPTWGWTRSSRRRCSRRSGSVRDRAGRLLQLRDYPTLTHVVGFVRERATQPACRRRRGCGRGRAGAGCAGGRPAPDARRGSTPVEAEVLSVVSEKTGYPPEMLDLDLDLEADLGVDTVKQAEVFAAIRETFGIERDETCSCGTTRR